MGVTRGLPRLRTLDLTRWCNWGNIRAMKVLRCSDDTYALIADHAGQRRLSLSQAVGELVSERVVSSDYVEDMALPVESVREVVREELERTLGDAAQLRGGVAAWLTGMFNVQLQTDSNVIAICKALGFEPSTS